MEDGADARTIWQHRRNAGHTDVIRGVTQVVMSIPILIVGGLLAYFVGGSYSILLALIVLALVIASIGRGTVRMIQGARTKRRAIQEIAALDRGRLPEARVIDRG